VLYNIFKKKNKLENLKEEKLKIVADIHEKNSLVIANLIKFGCIVELKSLKIGDYLIGNVIAERKSFQDFISSMLNKRLKLQLDNLKQYKEKILVIEGLKLEDLENKQEEKQKTLSPNALRGMILSICLDAQIPILFTKNEEETAKYLVLLAKKQLKPNVKISLHSRKPLSILEQKQYIIESFPNIGPKNAKKLLEHFGSIKNIINANSDELKCVIGKKSESILKLRE